MTIALLLRGILDALIDKGRWGIKIILEVDGREKVLFLEADEKKCLEIPKGAIVKSYDFGLFLI